MVETVATSVYLLDPAEIFQQAGQLYPRLGLVTVYRTLEKLEELGLIQRVHMDDGCHSYVSAPSGHQHLLVCTACRRVEYFSGDDLTPLVERLRNELGYDIQGHWLQLFGLCRHCQGERKLEPHPYEK